ncbi:IclR family transcriptional regulator [Sporolactobacillus pectinivorans]|uniref:IclR family transcriptional regulator n=1 Tax=Sporolactobacillus pectinivorans TaxID=1591408 RepID=UPI000C25F3BA|nr:IclR family transcriptional regulator [Sporolactobacillus pectinivorans]
MKDQENFVPSVHASLEILEWLALEENNETTLTEVAKGLAISKSTCMRILKTLALKGYVHYDEDSRHYSLGASLIALGSRARNVNHTIKKAISYLPRVSEDTGMTAVLVKRVQHDRLMYLAKHEPLHRVRLTVSVGETFPIPAGALGKCFLAFLDSSEYQQLTDQIKKNGGLQKYTERSLTDPMRLEEQMNQIRQKGIAESDGEYNHGISALACPVFDRNHKIILSLGVFMPSAMVHDIEIKTVKKQLISYANEMTEAISDFIG